jgi:hypothetical protein
VLGFPLAAPQVDAVYRRFIALCDSKKWVSDDEVRDIARDVAQATAA